MVCFSFIWYSHLAFFCGEPPWDLRLKVKNTNLINNHDTNNQKGRIFPVTRNRPLQTIKRIFAACVCKGATGSRSGGGGSQGATRHSLRNFAKLEVVCCSGKVLGYRGGMRAERGWGRREERKGAIALAADLLQPPARFLPSPARAACA